MTSRERIKNLWAGRPIDRIPNGLGACETAGMHVVSYNKLKELLDIEDDIIRMYTFMSTAVFELPVVRAMGGDMVILGTNMCNSDMWGDGRIGGWKTEMLWNMPVGVPVDWDFVRHDNGDVYWNDNLKCPNGSYYFDSIPESMAKRTHYREVNPSLYNPSHEIDEARLRKLERSAKYLYDNTDYSIVCGETITDLQLSPGGVENWWMLLALEPEKAREFLDKACEAGISQLMQLDEAVGKYADTLLIAHDMGDNRGVTMGPQIFRDVYKPFYKRLFEKWHDITDMKVMMHNCGSIIDVLGDLIECGVDAINPVQVSARGMEPENLINKFGDSIVFYGGSYDAIQCPSNTPEEVVYHRVKNNIETLSRHGRYIFAGVHNVTADTPKAHIRAMMKAYSDCAVY